MTRTANSRGPLKTTLGSHKRSIAFGVAVLILFVAAVTFQSLNRNKVENEVSLQAADEAKSVVKLTPEKLQAAGLHVTSSQTRELRQISTVSGRLEYNEAQRVAINAPAAGVVRQVLVSQEQRVRKGDRMAVMLSPDVGLARDELAQRQADLKLADEQAKRSADIAVNLSELLQAIKANPEPSAVAKEFRDKPLGLYRDAIISAYSKVRLADAIADATRPLGDKGIVGTTTIQEQASNKEVAAAKFQSVCEQSIFEANQDRNKDRAAVEHAERLLAVSRQRLAALTGIEHDEKDMPDGALSELVVRAPLDGVVVERTAVDTGHLAAGEPMFVVANTETIWVSAEVPERNWNSLPTAERYELMVRVPSLKEGEVAAQVKFTENKVSPETRMVSLIGELDNHSGQLRPGMFVWVSLAVGEPKRVLAVPATAIMRHENSSFVFVADSAGSFHRVDVSIGIETPEWVEVSSGLKEGQKVVDQGAFALKSELLLEREAG